MKQLLSILLVFIGALGLCAGCLDAVEDPRPGPMPDQLGAEFDPRPIRGGPVTNTYGAQNTYGEVYASGSGAAPQTMSPSTENEDNEAEDQPPTAGHDGAGGDTQAGEDNNEDSDMGGVEAGE